MSKRRRTKRAYEVSKRCHCPDQATCSHHWFLRVQVNGERQRINLTERFPGEAVEVAAARAKDMARKGLLDVAPPDDSGLTMGDVADRYVAARGGDKHHYLNGLRKIAVPAPNGTTVKLESKPIDGVTNHHVYIDICMWIDIRCDGLTNMIGDLPRCDLRPRKAGDVPAIFDADQDKATISAVCHSNHSADNLHQIVVATRPGILELDARSLASGHQFDELLPRHSSQPLTRFADGRLSEPSRLQELPQLPALWLRPGPTAPRACVDRPRPCDAGLLP